ncbi:MAG: hypothetical protein A2992_02305 [Elusimicrobia bacterium RIFCSPLOWO2_01_FULL_59_12]|nr:MAG: hypothetical protein A2992_02305 [Elusimicrobia bacterium RIFCSPLOWO2_01_FULL_59_12]
MYLPILTYHRLLAADPDHAADPKRIAVSQAQFRSHLGWLARLGYHSVSLADYPQQIRTRQRPAPKTFALTFDDGYEEVLTLALPVLKEFGYTATVFAVPGQMGGSNAWDDAKARLLSADQYRRLDKAGVTIGGHTSSHVHLPQVEASTARREIADSKKRLEEVLGHPVSIFAYPYGESTPDVEALVREAGFEAAFATDRAPRDHSENLFRIRRAVVFPGNTAWNILWKAQGWYPAYQDFKRRRGEGGTR